MPGRHKIKNYKLGNRVEMWYNVTKEKNKTECVEIEEYILK